MGVSVPDSSTNPGQTLYHGEQENCENINMKTVGTAYVLWLGCLFQLHGLHRLYNGKIVTGLIWFFTLGLFGVGQLIDLVLIPKMVEESNQKFLDRHGSSVNPVLEPPAIHRVIDSSPPAESLSLSKNDLMLKLLTAAAARGGKLSVTQGVMETGADFMEVETVLRSMVKTGYVAIDNDPVTGVVIYDFKEL